MALDAAQSIVQVDLVVQVVEASVFDEIAIKGDIIYLSDKYYVRISFTDVGNRPLPEFERHHVGHVAAEAVNAHLTPIAQYGVHVVPCARNRVEVIGVVAVVNAIVELDCLVPVVLRWESREAIVARCLGRKLDICIVA